MKCCNVITPTGTSYQLSQEELVAAFTSWLALNTGVQTTQRFKTCGSSTQLEALVTVTAGFYNKENRLRLVLNHLTPRRSTHGAPRTAQLGHSTSDFLRSSNISALTSSHCFLLLPSLPSKQHSAQKASHFKGKLRQNNITKQLEELLFSPSSAVPDAHPIFCHILPAYTVGFHPSLKFSKPLSSHIRAATPRCLITIR